MIGGGNSPASERPARQRASATSSHPDRRARPALRWPAELREIIDDERDARGFEDRRQALRILLDLEVGGVLRRGNLHQVDAHAHICSTWCESAPQVARHRPRDRGVCATLAPILESAGVPFIINDFPELVPAIGAQGAHVGQDDLEVAEARWRAGRSLAGELPPPIIRKSTHSLRKPWRLPGKARITSASARCTPRRPSSAAPPSASTKSARCTSACVSRSSASAASSSRNLAAVVAAGARRVVIVSGILQADDIAGYCREVKARLPEL